ncbi:hypothetical protein EC973_001890 [Apophysomyces ossiformis]|uniref:Uncharacterized protein n=1 Tax=Apophysomyces ossiformis TaxID=679940 RepID=A0A8H7ERK0_9FUNG|nr:hypothetical protein EC973_001890 [Apophysomyces ossiformis]
MGTHTEQVDTVYKDEIASVLLDLKRKKENITFVDVFDELKDTVVNSFEDGDTLQSFESSWMKRVSSVAALMSIRLEGSSTRNKTWKAITERLVAKDSNNVEASTTDTAPSSTRSSSASGRLDATDKEQIEDTFNNLDESKMWVLSTGTVVEKQMKALALASNFDHPCHSLILDPDDDNWTDYFTKEELHEIRAFRRYKLKELPGEVVEYLSSFGNVEDAKDCYKQAFQTFFNPSEQPDLSWIQFSFIRCARFFFKTGTIDFSNMTEADLSRVWDFIATAFDTSQVRAVYGEKASNATSNGRNKKRKLEAIEPRKRSFIGSKVDLLFTTASGEELGCNEVGIVKNDNSTKELNDGRVKQLKTLKAMLCQLASQSPSFARQLRTVGYTIMGPKVNMILMDFPAGYVCRVTRTGNLYFPGDSRQFVRGMKPLMALAWHGKSAMEESLSLMLNDREDIRIEFTGSSANDAMIPPCFWRSYRSL